MKEHGNKKPTKKRKKDLGGRPTKMTPDVIAKLEDAFTWGHTDEEACLQVNIDPSTLARYCQKNPAFASKKELLKQTPTLKARRTVVREIETNPELALKYLERKKKDEFSLRQEMDMTSNGDKIGGFVVVKAEPS